MEIEIDTQTQSLAPLQRHLLGYLSRYQSNVTQSHKVNNMSTISTDQQPSHSSVLHSTLTAKPPKIVGAQGHWFQTSDGYSIFDASGGAAVSCIGHGHPKVKEAIKQQLDTVEYCFSPWFTTDAYEKLATFLTESTNGVMEKVFICGSGAEALEAAIKMARQYYVEKEGPKTKRKKFIARERSYHGEAMELLSCYPIFILYSMLTLLKAIR